MTLRLRQWLTRKWQRHDGALAQVYHATFTSPAGQQVLQHLMDSVYCVVYEGRDVWEAAVQTGRRSLVHEILENIDFAEHPDKYRIREAPEG